MTATTSHTRALYCYSVRPILVSPMTHDLDFGWDDAFSFLGIGILYCGPLRISVTWPPDDTWADTFSLPLRIAGATVMGVVAVRAARRRGAAGAGLVTLIHRPSAATACLLALLPAKSPHSLGAAVMSTALRMVEQARTLMREPTAVGILVICAIASICFLVPLPA